MTTRAYTVVIPAFNAAAWIGDTIASVRAQTLPPAEIVVVDDGSSDGTAEVAATLGGDVRLIRQDNAGPGAATTRGIEAVATPYVATIDADDLWLPQKIERQFDWLEANGDTAVVFTKIAEFSGPRAEASYETAYDGFTRTTMLIGTAEAKAAGPVLDPPGRAGEMIDWFARLRETGHVLHVLPEVLALRRVHPGSLSNRKPDELGKAYLHVAREALLRRRAAQKAGS